MPKKLSKLKKESGGHRWQRVPPTETRGRVHTSTVAVAVTEPSTFEFTIKDADIEVFTTRDSGAGGQHRNVTDSCVVMRHIPTGIEAKSAMKSQHQNRVNAREILESRVRDYFLSQKLEKDAKHKKKLFGTGMRGDKIKTYREQDGLVIDHRSNEKISLKDVLKGKKI